MLQVKFFQVSSVGYPEYYVRVRHAGIVVDTTHLRNVWEHTAPYIKSVMTWGYDRSEIDFVLDPTLDNDAAESIKRDIATYADEV